MLTGQTVTLNLCYQPPMSPFCLHPTLCTLRLCTHLCPAFILSHTLCRISLPSHQPGPIRHPAQCHALPDRPAPIRRVCVSKHCTLFSQLHCWLMLWGCNRCFSFVMQDNFRKIVIDLLTEKESFKKSEAIEIARPLVGGAAAGIGCILGGNMWRIKCLPSCCQSTLHAASTGALCRLDTG